MLFNLFLQYEIKIQANIFIPQLKLWKLFCSVIPNTSLILLINGSQVPI